MEEIKMMKRNKVERLTIAITLLDSVIRECDVDLINKTLSECMKNIDACTFILSHIAD